MRSSPEVRISKSGSCIAAGGEFARDRLLVDGRGIETALRHCLCDAPRGGHDVLTAAVGKRERDRHGVIVRRHLDGLLQRAAHLQGQPGEIAQRDHADTALHQALDLGHQIAMQQGHQEAHFGPGPAPVFARKSEQCEIRNAEFARRLDHRADRVLAAAMALGAG